MEEAVWLPDAASVISASIFQRQSTPEALGYTRAFRRRYNSARCWRRVRVGVAVLLGTAGVLLALMEPATNEYVAALAAAWLVVGRLWLEPVERKERRCGAIAQKVFDTNVFKLPWSSGLVGDRPAPEDVLNWGRDEDQDGLSDWYSDTGSARHPVDVLISQRSILTWARQDHQEHAMLLKMGVAIAFAVTVVVGLALQLSMGEYLLRLGFPVLPGVAGHLRHRHRPSAGGQGKGAPREDCQPTARSGHHAGAVAHGGRVPSSAGRIYSTRLQPGVPNYMYKRNRPDREQNMDQVVADQVRPCRPSCAQASTL